MGPLGDVGMLKCDFLGLKTLTVIHDAVALIHQHTPGFDIDRIPLDDPATFDIYNRGDTIAVFQVESGGMVGVCRQFDVKDIEDINAILALYRPGPMDLIPDYVKRKKGQAKVKAPHKLLDEVTRETYGVLVYQEQVMQAAQVMAGYTLGGADLLRRAMGKKDKEKMAKEREKFREGCAKLHGIKPEVADEVFDTLEKFAGYGFNRSHSAAYAWVSYQTAYLKANYPVEFMAAVMSNEVSNTDKISVFVGECERMGIQILAPDLNLSGLKFEPGDVARLSRVEQGSAEGRLALESQATGIRYGLSAIKNVGESAMVAAIAERARGGAYASLHDFCARVDARKINKKAVEALVKCGAFDFTRVERAQLFSELDAAMAAAASAHRDKASGQVSMFDVFETAPPTPTRNGAAKVPPWPQTEKLGYEKELLGFYVTGHPLDEYRTELAKSKYVPIAKLPEQEAKTTVTIGGTLASVEKKFTKKDSKPFAVVVIEDLTGQLEVMIWSEAYTKSHTQLVQGHVVSITGRLDQREECPRISADEVKPIAKPKAAPAEPPVVLTFARARTTEADLATVRDILRASPGTRRVELCFVGDDGRRLRLRSGDELRVALTAEVEAKLAPWL
jgi:DNA polymerase-3 subunit alpha